MSDKSIKVTILHVLFVTGLIFMFVGGDGHNAPRSVTEALNLGHVVLFILFVSILYTDWKGLGERPLVLQWVLVVSLSAVLSLLTESIQSLVGRHFDYMDIFKDLSGCVVGMLLLAKTGISTERSENFVRIFIVVILLAITSVPLFTSLADEYIAAGQFPVLASFETPLELHRWFADGEISIAHKAQHSGDSSLMAKFTTRKYSRVMMIYSLGKWEGYHNLEFSFFNPDTSDLRIICRIHDNEHKKHHNAYSDRFHRSFILKKGWNTFNISMDDIRDAPSTRKMNLNEIEAISFFSVSLQEPRIVYLDDILLSKKQN
jgi:hypothetical protein